MPKFENVIWKEKNKDGTFREHQVGFIMTNDDGSKSLKLNVIPAGGWYGWLEIREQKPKEQGQSKAEEQTDIEPF